MRDCGRRAFPMKCAGERMRIFLTGATGFLGAHIARRFEREDAEVALLIRPGSDCARLEPLPKNARAISGSLQKLPASEIEKFAPNVVIHAAWHGVTNQHRNDPAQIAENIEPTVRLVELARDAGAETFIGLGSQAEYGPLNRKISESDHTEPSTLYGATKLATCHLTRQLCGQFNLRWAWLRVFSTYGPMEDSSWLIPYLTQSLLRGERPKLTACEQRWDYLFGADAADAVCAVAKNPQADGVFNLGSGRAESLRKIVERLRDAIDANLPLGIGEVPYRPDQVMHLEADMTRLTAATGWTPATSLEDGLRQTVAWHRAKMESGPR
jgi:UDP-glucose 4-epimerase